MHRQPDQEYPSKPLSDHQPAHLLSFNAKHARFFEAKLMQWAAFRLEALHAVLAAEPADDDEALRTAWLKEKLGRSRRTKATTAGARTIGSGGARGGTGRGGGGSSSGVRHDWLRGLLGMLRVRRGGII